MFEWTCSPYDSVNDKYYLPYFGETSEIFQFVWEPSKPGVTYVYPINSNELNCTGLVTALEFCYTTTIPPNNQTTTNFFNFQMLKMKTGNVFEVNKTILVRATPSAANCTNSNPRRCCEIMQFDTQDQFNITSPNLAFAIGPPREKIITHEGLFTGLYPMYSGLFYERNDPLNLMGTTTLGSPVSLQSLRLAWLHIGESNFFNARQEAISQGEQEFRFVS